MSEEKRKVKHIAARIISHLSFVVSIVAFVFGSLIIPFALGSSFLSPGLSSDFISGLLITVALFLMVLFVPTFIIGLILSIVTLFIERDLYFRVRPFILVMAIILIFSWFLALLSLI